jgi:hypothetical protein
MTPAKDTTMHPPSSIKREIMQGRVADLHHQAERDRIARTASRTPDTRREKREPNLVPSRRAILVRRALARLSALIPSLTR